MAQQFRVPQFIEREAKLIGPLTIKQSVILGGAGAIIFVLWFMVEKFLFFPLAFLIAAFSILLGFMKLNNRSLIDFVASFFSFFISPQLYIWQKRKASRKMNEKFIKQERKESEEETKELTKEQILQLAQRLSKK